MEIQHVPHITPQETGVRIIESALAFRSNVSAVEKVRSLVRLVVPEHEDLALAVHSEIAAVYAFASEVFRYTRDPLRVELHYSPLHVLKRIEDPRERPFPEDCDTYTLVLAMLWALGRRARLVLAGTGPRGRYTHVFVEAWQPGYAGLRGRWVIVDPSLGEKARDFKGKITTVCILDPFRSPSSPTP